jgi:hypothetical protein
MDLWILSTTTVDDGSYRKAAITLAQAAMTVVSEHRMPTEWANCNLALSEVILLSNDSDATPREKEEHARIALAASENVLRVYQSPDFPRPWVFAKLNSATARLRLSELTDDSRQREQNRQAACEPVREVTSRFDEITLRALGVENSLVELSIQCGIHEPLP